jgi:flagellin
MIINHNMSAINANRSLKFRHWEVDKSTARLASGMRINNAGDDPSGLAVSEKMRTQIQGLRQAERNTEDGMSFLQTVDGFLNQQTNILQRIRVLAVQSANGIYHNLDRQLIQVEVSALVDEIDRIASQAEFNKFKLLLGDFAQTNPSSSMWFQVGANMYQRIRVFVGTMTSQGLGISLGMTHGSGRILTNLSTATGATRAIGTLDDALHKIAKLRADVGAYSNRMEFAAKGLMNAYENIQSSESRIRDADMAETFVELTKDTILTQSSTSMLAQANMRSRLVLQLLGGNG